MRVGRSEKANNLAGKGALLSARWGHGSLRRGCRQKAALFGGSGRQKFVEERRKPDETVHRRGGTAARSQQRG